MYPRRLAFSRDPYNFTLKLRNLNAVFKPWLGVVGNSIYGDPR